MTLFAMKTYERLAESDRHLRRTGMDALEVLREQAGFEDDDWAEFDIGLMRLPAGNKVGLTDVRFDSPTRKTVCCVSLPTSTHFSAKPAGKTFTRRFEIWRLQQATITGRGHVR